MKIYIFFKNNTLRKNDSRKKLGWRLSIDPLFGRKLNAYLRLLLAENWLKRLKPSTNLPSTINEYESSKARQKRKTLEFQKLISLEFI